MGALRKWLFCGILYKVIDILTTLYLVYKEGNDIESSPFVLDMMYAYGVYFGLMLNGAIVSILLYVLFKYKEKELLMIATFLLMIPVVFNTLTILGL